MRRHENDLVPQMSVKANRRAKSKLAERVKPSTQWSSQNPEHFIFYIKNPDSVAV